MEPVFNSHSFQCSRLFGICSSKSPIQTEYVVLKLVRVCIFCSCSAIIEEFINYDQLDALPVPGWSEDSVRETKCDKVLDHFLPEVMVDPINLFFFEERRQMTREFSRRFQVASEGLLNDYSRPATTNILANIILS